MKLSTFLLLLVLVVVTSSVATVVEATSETETETAAAATAVEGSCNAAYDAEGNVVEGDCDADAGSENDDIDGDNDEDGDEDKPDFSKYDCNDMNKECDSWAGQGECDANPKYMLQYCRRSCEVCPDQIEAELARQRALENMSEDDLKHGLDMGVKQDLVVPTFNVFEENSVARISKSRQFMKDDPVQNKELRELAQNTHAQCTAWAIAGECEKNPAYMITKCCPACMTCNQLSIEGRCPVDPDAKQAWQPGDLNKMFERLANEPYLSKYDVNVLSRDPWVITMDNVLTAEEAEILIELGANEGYVRSSDVGKRLADGTFDSKVSDFRTSYNAWCQDDCYRDPVTTRVIERISNLTGIDDTNSEYLQMLKYEPGQYYKAHHDYIVHNRDRQQGVRILTVFLYLNDVEEGGGTNFDTLDITVEPKTGRALLWPSVLDDEPHEKDGRTTHQALPVIAGVKYGANAWFHQYDFKGAHKRGCTA